MVTLEQGRLTVYDGSSRHGSKYKDKEHESQRVPIRKHLNEALPSQHLWVGNVSSNVTEMTLAEQFSRFGDIESLRLYSSKNYAFVTLNTVEDAMYAKKGLHGTVLGGLAIRIEFVKGVSIVFQALISLEAEFFLNAMLCVYFGVISFSIYCCFLQLIMCVYFCHCC